MICVFQYAIISSKVYEILIKSYGDAFVDEALIYILIITQIVWLIMYISNKTKKVLGLFILELITFVCGTVMATYYEQLSGTGMMPGLSYLGEILLGYLAVLLTSLIFVITTTVIIIRTKKSWLLFFALLFFVRGTLTVTLQIHLNWGVQKVKATVLEYTTEQSGSNVYDVMRVSFSAEGKEYVEKRHIYEKEYEIGEEIDIYIKKIQPTTYDEEKCALKKC